MSDSSSATAARSIWSVALATVIDESVRPGAHAVDRDAMFPSRAIAALGDAGLLGLTVSTEMGGIGCGLVEAAEVVRRLAGACGSTAMVVCMHYSAVAVIEAFGPEQVRRDIAAGRHLSTLAFSERGSRSHFWAPLSTAVPRGDQVVLDAHKSWVTSAGEADSYVWTSQPATAAAGVSLWLVPADSPNLRVAGGFDGLGLRGNASCPIDAVDATIPASAALGPDGDGLDVALGVVLPVFQVLNASCSLGFMDAALAATVAHLTATRLEHLDQTLAQQALPRQHLARMRNRADAASALVADTIDAITTGRDDAMVRVLQSKTVAGETANEVLDLALRVGGGAAFRKESDVERFFRDARASMVMAPTVDTTNDFIGRALCGLPLFED
jgi:isovaleryl-CoA dehydrogenase